MAEQNAGKLREELTRHLQQRSRSDTSIPRKATRLVPVLRVQDVSIDAQKPDGLAAPKRAPPLKPVKPRGLSGKSHDHAKSTPSLNLIRQHTMPSLSTDGDPPPPPRKAANELLLSMKQSDSTPALPPRRPPSSLISLPDEPGERPLLPPRKSTDSLAPSLHKSEGGNIEFRSRATSISSSPDAVNEGLLIVFHEADGTIDEPTPGDLAPVGDNGSESEKRSTNQAESPLQGVAEVFKRAPQRFLEVATPVATNVSLAFKPVVEGISKAAEVSKDRVFQPTGEFLSAGFQQTGVHVNSMFGKMNNQIEAPEVFAKTKDDFIDLGAKMKGGEGLCSQCRRLPGKSLLLGKNVQWTTPLARVIYHADWCHGCRMLLDQLCEDDIGP